MGNATSRSALEQSLARIWTRRSLQAVFLLPVALLYRLVGLSRHILYRLGVFPIGHVDVPVIVVGNVIAGGAGKTPTVIAIVRHLQARGYVAGVVSRGYGRHGSDTREVHADSAAGETGDEPLLIRRATAVPVFVGTSRLRAAQALLNRYPATTVILCDDGLQHYRLYRDLEVCVFDDRGCGNGWLLPAGPLREPWPRSPLVQAGQSNARLMVLHTGNHPRFDGFRAQRFLADHATHSDGSVVTLDALASSASPPLMAIAAIAQPERFFDMLKQRGLPIAKTLALPDHYDFDSWSCTVGEGYQLICTEKDAVKLWQHVPGALAVPLVQTMESGFWSALDQGLAAVRSTKLSFPHGHKTS